VTRRVTSHATRLLKRTTGTPRVLIKRKVTMLKEQHTPIRKPGNVSKLLMFKEKTYLAE